MKIKQILVVVLLIGALSSVAYADSLYGSCHNDNGDKCTTVHRISTSWNGKTDAPRNGRYEIDFGGSVDSRITVYCDGSSVGAVHVKGSTRLNIVCR